MWKTIAHFSQPGSENLIRSRKTFSITSAEPWMIPHSTKPHAAPCHSPPSVIVIMRLRAVFSLPPRLPPSGM